LADRLATPEDLASLLERDDIDAYKAGMLIECATAVVQEAAGGQRIVQVVDDVQPIMGTTDSWLPLPQIPVTAVASVVLDGTTLTVGTDYQVFGSRLWRSLGWQTNLGWPMAWPIGTWGPGDTTFNWVTPTQQPSLVVVTDTHGYPPGSQGLQLGRQAVLSLCAGVYPNPTDAVSESIDDYTVTYSKLAKGLDASKYLKAALAKQYGRRAGLVRLG
jgi:hypothetical protein